MSGSVSERATPWTYVAMSLMMSGLIYPVITHWCWSDFGWLANGASTWLIDGTTGVGYEVNQISFMSVSQAYVAFHGISTIDWVYYCNRFLVIGFGCFLSSLLTAAFPLAGLCWFWSGARLRWHSSLGCYFHHGPAHWEIHRWSPNSNYDWAFFSIPGPWFVNQMQRFYMTYRSRFQGSD
jgi:hypothetical protein